MSAVRQLSYDSWKQRVDELFNQRTCANWAMLCGDEEPLQQAYEQGETPQAFVQRFIDDYDLMTADTDPWSFGRP